MQDVKMTDHRNRKVMKMQDMKMQDLKMMDTKIDSMKQLLTCSEVTGCRFITL